MTSARHRRALVVVVAALALAAAWLLSPQSASAQGDGTAGFEPPAPQVTVPSQLPATPSDFSIDASAAINAANEDPRVEELRAERGELSAIPKASRGTWELAYIDGGKSIAHLFVDGDSGEVEEFWTGPQVEWPMARGYESQFGHALNAPYVWIPLALLFFVGLFDFRRPRRLAHLDLLVLLSFGISQLFFNSADIGVSVPLAYPPLLYLLARMLWIGLKGGSGGLRPSAPIAVLAIATVLLIGGRIALNLIDSGVIDVGFAGVVGADLITDGEPLYGDGAFPEVNERGDTYGPANYLAYVPFEQVWPWSGEWDDLPAAHAAVIFFDLAAIAGLWVLGGMLRPGVAGRRLGIIFAFAWVSYPYTTFAMQSNANDSLVGALLIWAVVMFSSLGWRAALVAVAAAAKFTPIVLVPLFATGKRGLMAYFQPGETGKPGARLRNFDMPIKERLRILMFGTVLLAVLALLYVYPATEPGLATTWERTIETQVDRESPFSVWGQVSALQPVQTALVAAVAIFALALALAPRRRNLIQVAALSAAVMIAVQLTLEHWFYLYLPWFFGLLIVATTVPIAPRSASRELRGEMEGQRSRDQGPPVEPPDTSGKAPAAPPPKGSRGGKPAATPPAKGSRAGQGAAARRAKGSRRPKAGPAPREKGSRPQKPDTPPAAGNRRGKRGGGRPSARSPRSPDAGSDS